MCHTVEPPAFQPNKGRRMPLRVRVFTIVPLHFNYGTNVRFCVQRRGVGCSAHWQHRWTAHDWIDEATLSDRYSQNPPCPTTLQVPRNDLRGSCQGVSKSVSTTLKTSSFGFSPSSWTEVLAVLVSPPIGEMGTITTLTTLNAARFFSLDV